MNITTIGTEGSVYTPDGRTLSYLSVGPEDGPLVLHQHGGPSSRYEALLLSDIAQSVGVRIVVVDRPGMGKSTPQRLRSFKGWADDLQLVATALHADVFAVTGTSGGGHWALAAAYYIPKTRLAHASCLAGACYGTFGDNWAAQYLSKVDAFGGWLAIHSKLGISAMYAMLGLYSTKWPKQYSATIMKVVCPADQNVLKQPGSLDFFMKMSRECFRQGAAGLVIEAILTYKKWDFDVTKIERPVHFWQGQADTLMPPIINKMVAERMPYAIWHPVDGEGHLLTYVHPEIFQQAKNDIEATVLAQSK